MFKDFSVRTRLIAIIISVSAISILVTASLITYYAIEDTKADLVEDLNTLSKVIGNNTSASLAFNNREYAQSVISELSSSPSIIKGCLYDATGNIFAAYYPTGETRQTCSNYLSEVDYIKSTDNDNLAVIHQIVGKRIEIGTLYIVATKDGIISSTQNIMLTTVGVLLLALIVIVYPLAHYFQKSISNPIRDLVSKESLMKIGIFSESNLAYPKKNEIEYLKQMLVMLRNYILTTENNEKLVTNIMENESKLLAEFLEIAKVYQDNLGESLPQKGLSLLLNQGTEKAQLMQIKAQVFKDMLCQKSELFFKEQELVNLKLEIQNQFEQLFKTPESVKCRIVIPEHLESMKVNKTCFNQLLENIFIVLKTCQQSKKCDLVISVIQSEQNDDFIEIILDLSTIEKENELKNKHLVVEEKRVSNVVRIDDYLSIKEDESIIEESNFVESMEDEGNELINLGLLRAKYYANVVTMSLVKNPLNIQLSGNRIKFTSKILSNAS